MDRRDNTRYVGVVQRRSTVARARGWPSLNVHPTSRCCVCHRNQAHADCPWFLQSLGSPSKTSAAQRDTMQTTRVIQKFPGATFKNIQSDDTNLIYGLLNPQHPKRVLSTETASRRLASQRPASPACLCTRSSPGHSRLVLSAREPPWWWLPAVDLERTRFAKRGNASQPLFPPLGGPSCLRPASC